MARFPTDRQWDKNVGENLAAEKKSFNILEHTLVPEHILLSDEEAEKVLPAELFVRCHKSSIVNLKYVTDYSKMTLSSVASGLFLLSQ